MNPLIIIGGVALLALLAGMAGAPPPATAPAPALSATEHISISVQ